VGSVKKRVLFIGHSQVAFCDWKKMLPEHEASAFGVPGETVEALLVRTRETLKTLPPPDFVFLMAGLNNVAVDDFGFVRSYRKVFEAIQSTYPGCLVYACSLPPVLNGLLPLDAITRANSAIKDLAGEYGAGFLDLYGLIVEEASGGEGCFMPDGVHLNEKGYAIWAEAVRMTMEGVAGD